MAVVDPRLCVIGLCAAALAGCGGGGSMSRGGGNNSTTVTVAFSGTPMPTAVAAKIGTGAFSAQTLSGNTMTLTIPAGTSNYAIAYVCSSTLGQYEYVWEASTADATSLNYSCSDGGATGILTGSLDASAIPGAQAFWILSENASSESSADEVFDAPTEDFSITAPSGSDRVLAMVYGQSMTSQAPLAAKNFDNQTVPGALNGGNSVVFGAADATLPETLTYSNVPSGYGSPSTEIDLVMGGGGQVPFSVYALGVTGSYPQLPASATEGGDYYVLNAVTVETGSSASCAVAAGKAVSGGPVSFSAFPAPWSNCEAPTPAALPTFNMNYTGFSGQTSVADEATLDWTVSLSAPVGGGVGETGSMIEQTKVEATADYQGGSTTLAVPDLSGVAGFLANPASGTSVTWVAEMFQPSYALTSSVPPLNATWSAVSLGGTYTVP